MFVTWKQLGFFILLYLAALQNVPKELYESAADRRGQPLRRVPERDGARGPVRPPRWCVILATITGANLFTEPYLLTNGGGPNGASTSPVLVMYQRGIEQGNPDVAAAIGVLLVIGVLRDLPGQPAAAGEGLTWHRTSWLRTLVLFLGALVFLFPFYYMVVGSLQEEPDTSLRRRVPDRRADLRQLPRTSTSGSTCSVAGQLRHLHRRGPPRHRRLRGPGRLRAGPAALPRAGHPVRGDAAGADRAVPAADHPDLRDDRAHLRAGGLLPRDDPAVRDQLDRGVHLPAVLPAAARGAVRRRPPRRRQRAADPLVDRAAAGAPRARSPPRC